MKQTPRWTEILSPWAKVQGLWHFAKVCLTSRRQQGGSRMVGNVQVQENEEQRKGTINEIGQTQQYPQVNMVKLVNTLRKQTNRVQTHNTREEPNVQCVPRSMEDLQ